MAVPAGQRWVVMEEGVVPQVMTSGVRALEESEAVTSLREGCLSSYVCLATVHLTTRAQLMRFRVQKPDKNNNIHTGEYRLARAG